MLSNEPSISFFTFCYYYKNNNNNDGDIENKVMNKQSCVWSTCIDWKLVHLIERWRDDERWTKQQKRTNRQKQGKGLIKSRESVLKDEANYYFFVCVYIHGTEDYLTHAHKKSVLHFY